MRFLFSVLHLRNANIIHYTKSLFSAVLKKKMYKKNFKCSRFGCPYCKSVTQNNNGSVNSKPSHMPPPPGDSWSQRVAWVWGIWQFSQVQRVLNNWYFLKTKADCFLFIHVLTDREIKGTNNNCFHATNQVSLKVTVYLRVGNFLQIWIFGSK